MSKRYLVLIPILLFSGCKSLFKHESYLNSNKEYGVFLGASTEDLSTIKKYKKVVEFLFLFATLISVLEIL